MAHSILLRSLPSRHSDTQLEPFRLCLRPTDMTDHEGFSRQLRRCGMERDRSVLLWVTISCFIGLAALLVPAGEVYARETIQSCEDKGYRLCPSGQCGSVSCGGKTKPGDSFCSQGTGNPTKCYMCDGCTGTWVEVGRSKQGPGGTITPEGALLPPTSTPTSPPRMPGTGAPGMTSPIMPRGVEGGPGVEGEHSVEQVPAGEPSKK
jgi:hypothetical protein